MRVLRINPFKPERKLILEVIDSLNNGEIIIYPTDTVYGIGCRIIDLDSVRKIFEIKKRHLNKPLSIACSDLEMVKRYAILNKEDERFIRERIDKPFTFVVKKKTPVDDLITSKKDTVGIRLPPLKIVREIIENVNCPIITTSANTAGRKAPSTVNEIENEILNAVDLVIDSGRCRIGKPSTVIDVRTKRIIRD